MQNFVSKALAETAEQARDLGRYFILLATAMMLVLVFAVAGLGFLTAAAYLWLSAQYGQLEAVLGIGGFFVVVAGLTAVAATGMKPAGAKVQASVKAAAVNAPPNVPTPAAVETLLKALDDGGHHNERLAVLATSEAIRNAKPMQLIVTGLVVGFAGGQLLKQTMKKRPIL
ncbi:hypothetical protein PY365_25715 [Roseiarcaceae bacterium H3SJ34-1]|uniref:hypothetical protein n=1 Tax=Terripilifer ovatus TaxID=3032367 RepID=UPI003AB95632|nr:hypothetical protein [Roseiarcaceae bacterium H3SJ34-1]